MVAGDYLSKENIVKIVVEEAPERIKELVEWGIDFDKRPDGTFDLHKEGGHSDFRILHHKDNTGFEVERALVEACKKNPNIELVNHYFAVELITQHYLGQTVTRYDDNIECYGIYALNKETGKVKKSSQKSLTLQPAESEIFIKLQLILRLQRVMVSQWFTEPKALLIIWSLFSSIRLRFIIRAKDRHF